MSMTDEIMSQISMPTLAGQLGTDEATAREAVEAALPTLLAGVTGEAANPRLRPRLAAAAQRDHDPALLDADDPIERVDPTDGDRIVGHVFGDQREEVEARLQGAVGDRAGGLVSRVLPMLAPLVMAWLARKMAGGSSSGGGGLGDILGDVLGGRTGGGAGTGGAGGGLGDVLGDVLGGGASGGSPGGSGGLGDILGDVLGGGTGRAAPGGSASGSASGGLGDVVGDVLGQLGGAAGSGGGLDDLLGSVLGGTAKR